jgi:uncharacterized protein YeaC (DUF1315 family)
VGKIEFLAWPDSELLPVVDTQRDSPLGIVVAPIDAANTAAAVVAAGTAPNECIKEKGED